LRELTRQPGVVLIFDGVVTGFRVSPGGAQAEHGIRPDLTTLAKILAGGLPGGTVAGRKDILDLLDFQVTKASNREKISHRRYRLGVGCFPSLYGRCGFGWRRCLRLEDRSVDRPNHPMQHQSRNFNRRNQPDGRSCVASVR
jgi:hypothetical protein